MHFTWLVTYSDSVGVLTFVSIIARTSPHEHLRHLFRHILDSILDT